MNPLESDNKLVTFHSWFACPLLDLQAESRTRVRNGGAPLMLPRYLHLDLPKHVMRNVSRFRLRAHTLAAESSIWRGGNGHCDKCSCAAVQNEQLRNPLNYLQFHTPAGRVVSGHYRTRKMNTESIKQEKKLVGQQERKCQHKRDSWQQCMACVSYKSKEG